MALFGLFGKKSETSLIKKHGERAANKRAQAIDRWEAIQALASQHTAEGVEALLPRFGFRVDPSITDEEEKEAAFQGILESGDEAVAPVKAYLRRAEAIAWPLKILDRLAGPEDVVSELLAVLADMDTEYERDPSRKIDILATLEERQDARIVDVAARFLEDANETVRFSAVGAIYAQDAADAARDGLVACFCQEESVRIRNRILEGFVQREWQPGDRVADMRPKVPDGFLIDRAGKLSKRG